MGFFPFFCVHWEQGAINRRILYLAQKLTLLKYHIIASCHKWALRRDTVGLREYGSKV